MNSPAPSARAAILDEAADLLGTIRLAEALGVSRRSLAYWKKGAKQGHAYNAGDETLRALLPLLDAHIARAAQLRRAIMAELFGDGAPRSSKRIVTGTLEQLLKETVAAPLQKTASEG